MRAQEKGGAHRTTAECGELLIHNPDHAVHRRVKDEVVKLIVAVDDARTAGLALVRQVPLVPCHELRLARVDVLHRGLGVRDFGRGLDLARELRLVQAEIFEADVFWACFWVERRASTAESQLCFSVRRCWKDGVFV